MTTSWKKLFFALKVFCLLLLYIVLVWNKGRYDNDAFLFFYLVLFLAHAIVPYLAVQFFEKEFAINRNLPITLLQRTAAYLLPYVLLLLPETFYFSIMLRISQLAKSWAIFLNLPLSLFLLTAIQYSGAQSREEYIKAVFVLGFASLFAFHVQAFWFWLAAQFIIAVALFVSGYYSFEKEE